MFCVLCLCAGSHMAVIIYALPPVITHGNGHSMRIWNMPQFYAILPSETTQPGKR